MIRTDTHEDMDYRIAEFLGTLTEVIPGVSYTAPHYTEDLNLMHEAEGMLIPKDRLVYADHLNTAVDSGFYRDYYDGWCGENGSFAEGIYGVAHASAYLRAHAFLQTISNK